MRRHDTKRKKISLKRVVSFGVFSRSAVSATGKVPSPILIHGKFSNTPLYRFLRGTQPKRYPARPWFMGSLAIHQFSYLLRLKDGLPQQARNSSRCLVAKCDILMIELQIRRNIKHPGKLDSRYLFRHFQKYQNINLVK